MNQTAHRRLHRLAACCQSLRGSHCKGADFFKGRSLSTGSKSSTDDITISKISQTKDPLSHPPTPAASFPFSPNEWRRFPLVASADHTHDTKTMDVALPSPSTHPNLPVASCVLLALDSSSPTSPSPL